MGGRKGRTRGAAGEAGALRASSCGATFSERQLEGLNLKFSNLLEGKHNPGKVREKQISCVIVMVERLIQRLVCNVGTLDPRFSSKFLVNLEPIKSHVFEGRRLKLKYLVRLDAVSTPALYPHFFEPPVQVTEGAEDVVPQGYAKLRVHGEYLEQWIGFINPNGFLRRDKIQERFVELLARAAARPGDPQAPSAVDESRLCGSPGKVVDPVTLAHVLATPPSHQVFFGPAESNEGRFPDPRDFRIAIVEGNPEARLHISFLSSKAQSITPEEEVEISIMVGVGVRGWPWASDFPSRLPLDHVDVILGYKAAQLGYYLVPAGPHPSVHCEDRSAVWEVRMLATETFLLHHYAPGSVVARVHKILASLLEVLRARGVKTINRYILKNLLFFELEQKGRILQWAPNMISRRVLSILDSLLISLRNQKIQSYFFPEKNLLLQDDALDEDYVSDGDILEHYIKQLHNEGHKVRMEDEDWITLKDQMENVLLQKWDNLIANMLPAMSNRSTRLSVVHNSQASISYTRRQMEYVAVMLKEVLKLKHIQRKGVMGGMASKSLDEEENTVKSKEDFMYLLQIMFDQAKQKLCSSLLHRSEFKRTGSKTVMKLERIILSYDISTAMLIDDIRRSKRTDYYFENDTSIVVKVMECLYKAIDSDGRILGPVLRPYLTQIFRGSHENSAFLFEWKKKSDMSEFSAIGAFASLVLSGRITPLEGIVNSAEKGWTWASRCLQIIQAIKEENSTRIITGEKLETNNSGLRLIFAPAPEVTVRHTVSARRAGGQKHPDAPTWRERGGGDSRAATIRSFQDLLDFAISPGGNYTDRKIGSILAKSARVEFEAPLGHGHLRDGNPFAVASAEVRRRGNHRGLGSIVQALISLRKLTILQEISQFLPVDERTRVLGDIKKLSKEIQRLSVESSRSQRSFSASASASSSRFGFEKSGSLPSQMLHPKKMSKVFSTSLKKAEIEGIGVYRSKSELSVYTKDKDTEENRKEEKKAKDENLLGTCRQLRKDYRTTVFGTKTTESTSNGSKKTSTFPKSTINTPFYIKVSSYNYKEDDKDSNL